VAEELFVTQAAVSKRIHRLEDWLGVNLFSSDGRNLEISSAGKEFASDIEVAPDFLDHAVRKIKAPDEPVVRIASSTTISMYWLYDRLKAFSLSDNACNVCVTTTDSTTN
jgi:LysR family transcriptional regulator, glycine cleavage system transcriptional activator